MKPTYKVTIEKLVFGGQGKATLPDGQIVFVWNALPGETVEIQITKKKKTHAEAQAIHIISASKDRIKPSEEHFLSCSPWSILSFAKENEWKKIVAKETYEKIGGFTLENLPIVTEESQTTQYRNKIEYSFFEDENGNLDFAFFARGGKRKMPIPCCALASNPINKTAKNILNWVREMKIPIRSLKSLIVRSNKKEETIAALFIKDELEFSSYPNIPNNCLGFQIYYSSHKCPASRPDKLLYATGQDYLIENILGTNLKYGLLSFFQVNPPLFEKTLEQVIKNLNPNLALLDFYAGVGAIGLPLHQKAKHITIVDNNKEAISFANDNISLNNINHAEAHCLPAEKMTNHITCDTILVVDPPRAGMHKDVVEKIKQVLPPKIIYISCNLSTQARDVGQLLDNYTISESTLYNYFPKTPHIESLLILDRK